MVEETKEMVRGCGHCASGPHIKVCVVEDHHEQVAKDEDDEKREEDEEGGREGAIGREKTAVVEGTKNWVGEGEERVMNSSHPLDGLSEDHVTRDAEDEEREEEDDAEGEDVAHRRQKSVD